MQHRRRIITRAIVFLVLGAIVNVAVAWGCASVAHLLTSFRVSEGLSGEDIERLLHVTGVDPEIPPFPTEFGADRFPGVRHHWMMYGHASSKLDYEIRAGSPFASLRGVRQTTFHQTDRSFTLFKVPGTHSTYLPYGLVWPGFTINTVFYAAILWLLFAAPFALRRRLRRKRGLCPSCAYPIGDSPVCTECGKPINRSQAI